MNLEEIEEKIRNKKSIEEVLKFLTWKDFELITKEIFERNGFNVRFNYRFKTTKRYQIDILAEKRDVLICVDCKHWRRGYKVGRIKKAALKQKERINELMKILEEKKIVPIILTLLDMGIYEFENVFIIPIFYLNEFLNSNF
ncbi:MAG: restriction endonuclease [Candidatus Aenigmatarchaeota archaeon]